MAKALSYEAETESLKKREVGNSGNDNKITDDTTDESLEKLEQTTDDALQTSEDRNKHINIITIALQTGFSDWLVILSLIFGGCCSNVFTLEAIIKEHPFSGNLITFVQFSLVATEGYLHFFDISRPPFFLGKPHVPFIRYVFSVIMFFLVSILNNSVWKYHISVPVHIIFRSGGTVMGLIVGVFCGKRFSLVQIASVILLTTGVIVATLCDPELKHENSSSEPDIAENTIINKDFVLGIMILFLAQLISAIMGQVNEFTYKKYGSYWRENLFYMHFLSLPFFLPMRTSIRNEFANLGKSDKISLTKLIPNFSDQVSIPESYIYLAFNALTQYVCVRGVNKLAGTASAVTVTIVLNVRKCMSLLLSIYIFGNVLSVGTCIGAAVVFLSAGWYSIESSRLKDRQAKSKIH
ncbi:UAA transporter family-domain-containing protein [Dipodascopsis uninucleata]